MTKENLTEKAGGEQLSNVLDKLNYIKRCNVDLMGFVDFSGTLYKVINLSNNRKGLFKLGDTFLFNETDELFKKFDRDTQEKILIGNIKEKSNRTIPPIGFSSGILDTKNRFNFKEIIGMDGMFYDVFKLLNGNSILYNLDGLNINEGYHC